MPALEVEYAAPSNLAVVIGQVRDAFEEMGNATPIMIGKQYLENVGAAPRVLFVPEPNGKIGPAIELGNAVSVTHSCDVYIRAEPIADDLERFARAYELSDLVIDCIQTAATGRVEWSDYSDTSPTDTDDTGADIALSFTYQRDVPHSAIRRALAPAGADISGARPALPPGDPGTVESIDVTTEPEED